MFRFRYAPLDDIQPNRRGHLYYRRIIWGLHSRHIPCRRIVEKEEYHRHSNIFKILLFERPKDRLYSERYGYDTTLTESAPPVSYRDTVDHFPYGYIDKNGFVCRERKARKNRNSKEYIVCHLRRRRHRVCSLKY